MVAAQLAAAGQMGATRCILSFLNVTVCPSLVDTLYARMRMTLDLTRVSEVKVADVALHSLPSLHPTNLCSQLSSAQHATFDIFPT